MIVAAKIESDTILKATKMTGEKLSNNANEEMMLFVRKQTRKKAKKNLGIHISLSNCCLLLIKKKNYYNLERIKVKKENFE